MYSQFSGIFACWLVLLFYATVQIEDRWYWTSLSLKVSSHFYLILSRIMPTERCRPNVMSRDCMLYTASSFSLSSPSSQQMSTIWWLLILVRYYKKCYIFQKMSPFSSTEFPTCTCTWRTIFPITLTVFLPSLHSTQPICFMENLEILLIFSRSSKCALYGSFLFKYYETFLDSGHRISSVFSLWLLFSRESLQDQCGYIMKR